MRAAGNSSGISPDGSASVRFWLYAGIAVLVLHAVLIFVTFRDYGMSWDQPWDHRYEQAIARFYLSGGHDNEAQGHYIHFYGGFFDITAALVEKVSGLKWIEARDLTSALYGWIGIFAILRTGWIVFEPATGVLAGLFLTLTPVYYGHQFINPKDTPFAVLTMLALYFIIRLALEYPTPRWSTAGKAGLAIGAAMGVRVGGLILFGPLGIATVLTLAFGVWLAGFRASVRPGLKLLAQVILILPLAWTVMTLAWPFAWTDPLRAPLVALDEFVKYPWDGNVFYNGELLKPWNLPWTYIPNLVARTMPEHVLLGLLAGAFGIVMIRRIAIQADRSAIIGTVALLAAIIWPVGVIWDMDSNLYDGYRQVLFIIPPLVLLSAAGAWNILQRFNQPVSKVVVRGLFVVALACVVFDLHALHPYEYIYFNRSIAGGLARANKSYDLDYWATGLREAAEWATRHYNPTPGQPVIYSLGMLSTNWWTNLSSQTGPPERSFDGLVQMKKPLSNFSFVGNAKTSSPRPDAHFTP